MLLLVHLSRKPQGVTLLKGWVTAGCGALLFPVMALWVSSSGRPMRCDSKGMNPPRPMNIQEHMGRAKVGLQLWAHKTIYSHITIYCIVFRTNSCRPTFAHSRRCPNNCHLSVQSIFEETQSCGEDSLYDSKKMSCHFQLGLLPLPPGEAIHVNDTTVTGTLRFWARLMPEAWGRPLAPRKANKPSWLVACPPAGCGYNWLSNIS